MQNLGSMVMVKSGWCRVVVVAAVAVTVAVAVAVGLGLAVLAVSVVVPKWRTNARVTALQ